MPAKKRAKLSGENPEVLQPARKPVGRPSGVSAQSTAAKAELNPLPSPEKAKRGHDELMPEDARPDVALADAGAQPPAVSAGAGSFEKIKSSATSLVTSAELSAVKEINAGCVNQAISDRQAILSYDELAGLEGE